MGVIVQVRAIRLGRLVAAVLYVVFKSTPGMAFAIGVEDHLSAGLTRPDPCGQPLEKQIFRHSRANPMDKIEMRPRLSH